MLTTIPLTPAPTVPFTLAPTRPSSPAQEWSSAFDLWLASHPSPNTRRAYRKAWDLFCAFTARSPWEISKYDVARFWNIKAKTATTIQRINHNTELWNTPLAV